MSLASRPTALLKSLPLVLFSLSLLVTACTNVGSANSADAATTPSFVSAPATSASQGSTYTYQIETLPAAGSATLALTAAPSGATLSGNTLTWTPSAAQSRLPNQFSVRATTAAGSATQSWTVTPTGTVSGTWVDTYWTVNGPVPRPFDWTTVLPPPLVLPPPAALVPQPDGSFQTLPGSGNSDGTFSIPNVPGGYYWLQSGGALYWTSSSSFDFATDIVEPMPSNTEINSTTTTMNFNLAGLDPVQTGDQLAWLWEIYPPSSLAGPVSSPVGTTTGSLGEIATSNIDFSQSGAAFFVQYEPETIGPLAALALGPELLVPNLSLTNGTLNSVGETLAPSPQHSFDLNIKGSLWAPLFNGAGPSSTTPQGADLEIAVQPFVTGDKLASFGGSIPLLIDPRSSHPAFALDPAGFGRSPGRCAVSGPRSSGSSPVGPGEPPITADQDFGPAQYGDPFPPAWPRFFTFCQYASVPIPIPGSTTPITFQLVDQQSSSLPPSQVAPLIGQVQNPEINGASLLAPGTVAATGVILNWVAPTGTTPTGYKITTYVPFTFPPGPLGTPGVLTYLPGLSFYTARTSASLPPLQAGQTYVFLITAVSDGAANFETQPNRSALPTASISVVSAPITVSGGL